jgi:2'-5' RNA ligase
VKHSTADDRQVPGVPGRDRRLFVALWPGDRVRRALDAWRAQVPWPAGCKPVRPEKLHLTLHFLGQVPTGRVPALATALQLPFRPFELHLDAVLMWHGGLAVLRPRTPPPPLLALHADLAQSLQRCALPVEAREYRPHLTVARRAGPAGTTLPAPSVRWRVSGYALVESTADGRYRVVERYR